MTTADEKLRQIETLCAQPHKRNSLTAIQVLAICRDEKLDIPGLPRRIRSQDYGFNTLEPKGDVEREAHVKGFRAGRRSKYYDENSCRKAMDRFLNAYPRNAQLGEFWLRGWRAAAGFRL